MAAHARFLFLDHFSTTAPLDSAVEEAARVSREVWGNPSSPHGAGRAAARTLERARAVLAASVGALKPSEILFCSSGTEANNLAVQGVVEAAMLRRAAAGGGGGNGAAPVHAIAGADCHASVLEPLRLLARRHPGAFEFDLLPVDALGFYDWASLPGLLRPGTCLLSLLHLNNETGVVQDLGPAERLRLNRPALALHFDWVQSQGKCPIDMKASAADLLSCSAHKVGGVRGAAMLYVRAGTELEPLLAGGGQEKFRRAGTVDVAAAAGYARAVQDAPAPESAFANLAALESAFLDTLSAHGTVYRINGPAQPCARPGQPGRHPGCLNMAIAAFPRREDLLIALDLEGLCASATSACHSGIEADSHVLAAMGVAADVRAASIRLCFSPRQTVDDAQRAARVFAKVMGRAAQGTGERTCLAGSFHQ